METLFGLKTAQSMVTQHVDTVVQSYYNMYTTNAIYSVACGFKVRY